MINNVGLLEKEENIFEFRGKVEKIERIKEIRAIKDIVYSITKIYRFGKPALHFRRPYISLNPSDFDTIISGSIFWSRSAFGFFVNELNNLQFTKFLSYLAEVDPGFLLTKQSYNQVWSHLKSFIDQEFISAIHLFKALKSEAKHIEALEVENFLFKDIELSSGTGEKISDFVSKQTILFDKFSDSLSLEHKERGLFAEIDNIIKENEENETKFEKVFRGKPWPIRTIEL